jgi:hypothetical protein
LSLIAQGPLAAELRIVGQNQPVHHVIRFRIFDQLAAPVSLNRQIGGHSRSQPNHLQAADGREGLQDCIGMGSVKSFQAGELNSRFDFYQNASFLNGRTFSLGRECLNPKRNATQQQNRSKTT